MTISITHELRVFLAALIAGAAVSLLFDLFRAVRRQFQPAGVISGAWDLLFWVISAGIVTVVLYQVNSYRIRIFEFVAIILASIFYFLLFSRWILKLLEKTLYFLCKFVQLFFKIILTPLRFLYKILIVPFLTRIKRFGTWIASVVAGWCRSVRVLWKERVKKNERKKRSGNTQKQQMGKTNRRVRRKTSEKAKNLGAHHHRRCNDS